MHLQQFKISLVTLSGKQLPYLVVLAQQAQLFHLASPSPMLTLFPRTGQLKTALFAQAPLARVSTPKLSFITALQK